MAGITVACNHCGAQFKMKDASKVGKKAPCPKCKQPFVIRPVGESEPNPDFDLGDDDFGQGMPAEMPLGGKRKKGGAAGSTKGKGKRGKGKGKSKKQSGGGGMLPLLIGGGVLILLLGVGGLLWALGVFDGDDGGGAAPPVVAENGGGETPSAETTQTEEGSTPSTTDGSEAMSPDTTPPQPTGTETNTASTEGQPVSPVASADLPDIDTSHPPLEYLTPDADFVMHLRVNELRKSPLLKEWLEQAETTGDPEKDFEAMLGVPLAKLETVTLGGALNVKNAGMSRRSADGFSPTEASDARMESPNDAGRELQSNELTGFDENGEPVTPAGSPDLSGSASSEAMERPENISDGSSSSEFGPGAFGPPGMGAGGFGPPGFTPGAMASNPPDGVAVLRFANDVDLMQLIPLRDGKSVTEGNVTYYLYTPPSPGQPTAFEPDADGSATIISQPPEPATSPDPEASFESSAQVGTANAGAPGSESFRSESSGTEFGSDDGDFGQMGFEPPAPVEMAIARLDHHHLVLGEPHVLVPLLKGPRPWSPKVLSRFADVDFSRQITLLFDPQKFPSQDEIPAEIPADFQQVDHLLREQAVGIYVTLNFTDSMELRFGSQQQDESSASQLATEISRLWALVPPQLDHLPLLVPQGLKDSLRTLVESVQPGTSGKTAGLQLTLSKSQIDTLTAEIKAAAGPLMMAAMMAGGGGMPGLGDLTPVEPPSMRTPWGEWIALEGMPPMEASGLPETLSVTALLDWEVFTDQQGTETIEPAVFVAVIPTDESAVVAYRATEVIPERERSAGVITEVTLDQLDPDRPAQGAVALFRPRFPTSLEGTAPHFEGKLLLRSSSEGHEVVVPDLAKFTGAVEDPNARKLGMRITNTEGVIALHYRADARTIVGVCKVVGSGPSVQGAAVDDGSGQSFDSSRETTDPTDSPSANPFGGDGFGNSSVPGAGLPAEPDGIVGTKTMAGNNVILTFPAELPSDASLSIMIYPNVSVANVTLKFNDLPVPAKPETAEALRTAREDKLWGREGDAKQDGAAPAATN